MTPDRLLGTRVLVSGAAGFIGAHVVDRLRGGGADVVGTSRRIAGHVGDPALVGDLKDASFCRSLIDAVAPDIVVHAAGTAGGGHTAADVQQQLEANVDPTTHLLEAVRQVAPLARVVVIGSAAIYGAAPPPVREDAPMAPTTAYGVSKAAQELVALQYHLAHRLDVLRVRLFNIIGPSRSTRLLVPGLCAQIADAERTGATSIHVGDVTPRRDFLDVVDAVDAIGLLALRGTSGDAYNVASGTSRSVQEIVDLLLSMARHPIRAVGDEKRFRAADVVDSRADIRRLRSVTGWEPRVELARSLRAALDFARTGHPRGEA